MVLFALPPPPPSPSPILLPLAIILMYLSLASFVQLTVYRRSVCPILTDPLSIAPPPPPPSLPPPLLYTMPATSERLLLLLLLPRQETKNWPAFEQTAWATEGTRRRNLCAEGIRQQLHVNPRTPFWRKLKKRCVYNCIHVDALMLVGWGAISRLVD